MVDYTKIYMPEIWAESGDIVAPDSDKIKDGWAVEAVPRQWWNWMQNRVDNNVAYMLQKGIPEWDSSTQYIANKSYVQRTGIVYKAILTGTNQDPVSATTYWVKAFSESTTALEALRSVTPSANTFPYFDSATTATTTALSAFARTLLDDADAPTMRSTLSAQVAHANLTGLSAAAAGSNQLPYFTNSDGTMAVTPITAFARSILDDTDAATVRATLGLSTGATATVTTSAYDTTAGRLLKVGDFGIGSTDLIDNSSDLDTIVATGFYFVNGANQPSTYTGGFLQVVTNAGTRTTQLYMPQSSNVMFIRSYTGAAWRPWSEVHSSTNGASTAEAQAGTDDTKWLSPLKSLQQLKKYGVGSLNNSGDANVTVLQPALGALPTGIYSFNAGATNAPTPTNSGIVLHFERSNDSGIASGAYQMVLNGDGSTYTSQRNNITGVWSAWAAFSSATNSVQKTGDTMTGPLKFAAGTSAGIVSTTADGADNGVVSLGGGGSAFTSRGAVVNLYGNEHSTNPGQLNLYAGDTGTMSFITGQNSRLFISNAGNVIVQGSASGDAFTVNGTSKVNGNIVPTGYVIGTAGTGLGLINDTSSKLTTLCGGSSTAQGAFVEAYGSTHPSAPGELRLGGAVTTGSSLIRFYTQQTQRGIWLANGNLLIGTGTDVGPRLQVSGTAYASQDIVAAGSLFAGGPFGNSPTVVGPNTISIRSTDTANAGNVHLWFYNNNGTERGLIYWSNDGSCHFRTGGSGEMMNVGPQGNLTTSGTITGPTVVSNGQVWAGGGSGRLHPDGNVQGSIWGGAGAYLSNYLASTFARYDTFGTSIANSSVIGAIGSYAFLYNSSGTHLTPGQNLSGSSAIWTDTSESNGGVVGYGTWRCMGWGSNANATVYIRIA